MREIPGTGFFRRHRKHNEREHGFWLGQDTELQAWANAPQPEPLEQRFMTNITILGSGFGALTTVRELRKRGVSATITVISPKDELHYLPSSIWIPAKLRKAAGLKIPLAAFFSKNKVEYVQASVTGLKDKGRVVVTDKGEFANDHLVIATGGRFLKKLPGIENALTICEGLDIGEEIDRQLSAMDGGTLAFGFSTNPQEQGAVRGGPMFELLFIIDAYLKKTGRRDKFKLVFFSPAPKPGIRLGEKAVDKILADMNRRGIDTYLGKKLVRFEADKVVTEGAEFAADMIMFMPGMTGPAFAADAGLPMSPGGMIQADETCAVAEHPNVWVVGDAGSYPGPGLAGQTGRTRPTCRPSPSPTTSCRCSTTSRPKPGSSPS